MNVEVRSEAHLDIAEGVAFYDRQGYNAGDYFYQRIFEDIESLCGTAGIHERHFGYHRKIASRHPFLIYYRLVGWSSSSPTPCWLRRGTEVRRLLQPVVVDSQQLQP
jgi:hypothetical protein